MSLFPNSKTFLSLGGVSIQWYAICIMTGAFLAYQICQYRFQKLGYAKEILSDAFINVLFIGIIGARIWYVIFMFDELYINNPMEIFMIHHGGLAIQGGLFTGIAYCIYYFKKRDIDIFVAGDAIMPTVLIAQAFGRWGNFFNQEAHGGEVSLEFLKQLHLPQFIIDGMHINGSYYHPTFLYESVLNIVGFLLIVVVVKKFADKQGYQFFGYFIWYGMIRYFIESLRTDSLYVFGFKTAQLISILFVIAGLIGILYCKKYGKDIKQESRLS